MDQSSTGASTGGNSAMDQAKSLQISKSAPTGSNIKSNTTISNGQASVTIGKHGGVVASSGSGTAVGALAGQIAAIQNGGSGAPTTTMSDGFSDSFESIGGSAEKSVTPTSSDQGGTGSAFLSNSFMSSKSLFTKRSEGGQVNSSFSCAPPLNCVDEANQFFDTVNSQAGTINGSGFNTQTEANLAAAKTYLEPTLISKREANWITFQDPTTKKWGFTFPAVGGVGEERTNGPAIVRAGFDAANSTSLKPSSLGHTHFTNTSFSITDVLAFQGKGGAFVLANPLGVVSYVNKGILCKQYGLCSERNFIDFTKKFRRGRVQETGVVGQMLGAVDVN